MVRAHKETDPAIKEVPDDPTPYQEATGTDDAGAVQEEQGTKAKKVLSDWVPVGHLPF